MNKISNNLEKQLAKLPEEAAKKHLAQLSEIDKSAKEYASVLKATARLYDKKNHPDAMVLAELILHETGDKSLSDTESFTKIKEHLAICPLCKTEYLELKSDFPDLEKKYSVEALISKRLKAVRNKKRKLNIRKLVYYPIRIAASFLLLWLVVYSISELATPGYMKLGEVDITVNGISRSLTADEFSTTHSLITEENFNEAINSLLKKIASAPDDNGVFYSHYMIGLLYLRTAKSDYWGLFENYDLQKVKLAGKHFRLTIEKNFSGKYENITSDASFYLGKSYVLQQDFGKAKEVLKYVVTNKGSKAREAEKILSELR